MSLGITGRLGDRREIRAAFIGCGGHSFRNIYPTFQFAPVKLVATCDLSINQARAYAEQFGYHEDGVELLFGYEPDYFKNDAGCASAVWEPEFSLGQLYNKGLFLLGYYDEVNEFAQSIVEGRAPLNGALEQARQVLRLFEAFAHGPGKVIDLIDHTSAAA
jgi:predicted dehydrogenase